NLQAVIFTLFAAVTFAALYCADLACKPDHVDDLTGGTILITGQPLRLPVEPVLRLVAIAAAAVVAIATGAGMMADWSTLALYWYAPAASGGATDPIFNKPLTFYLFTLPAWQSISGWVMTLAVIAGAVAAFFITIAGGTRILSRGRTARGIAAWRGLSISVAAVLLVLAFRVYLGRFERLFADHTIFT